MTGETDRLLTMRNISDPDIVELRKQALGTNPPWAPTLLEVTDDHVRGWYGPRMSLRLVRLLGLRRAQRIARRIAHASAPIEPERRNFLRLLPAAAGTGLFLLSGGTAAAQTTLRAGIDINEQVIDVARRAPAFRQQLQRYPDVRFDWQTARSQTYSDKAWVTILGTSEEPRRAVIGNAAVDLARETVPFTQIVEFERTQNGLAHITVRNAGTVVYQGTVNTDGGLTPDPGYEQIQANHSAGPGDPSASGLCELAVSSLCSGAICFWGCGALEWVNGIAGLGCSVVCGLVTSLGCGPASEIICV
jgi:hypothetical protein